MVLEILISWFEEHEFVSQLVSLFSSLAFLTLSSLKMRKHDNWIYVAFFFLDRVAGCMPCWPAWRSLCCLEPTPPSDSWPGDVLSSAAHWYHSHCTAVLLCYSSAATLCLAKCSVSALILRSDVLSYISNILNFPLLIF